MLTDFCVDSPAWSWIDDERLFECSYHLSQLSQKESGILVWPCGDIWLVPTIKTASFFFFLTVGDRGWRGGCAARRLRWELRLISCDYNSLYICGWSLQGFVCWWWLKPTRAVSIFKWFWNDYKHKCLCSYYSDIPCELPVFQTRFWSPPASACLCSGYGVADEKLCTCCSVYLLFRRVPEGVRGLARCRIEVNYDVWGCDVAPISTAQSQSVTQPDTAELAVYSQSAYGC